MRVNKVFRTTAVAVLLVSCLSGLALGKDSATPDTFVFEVSNPHFRITVPDLPLVKMKTHPLHKKQPHLQYMGSSGPYNISVITPTADPGMTAMDCAVSISRSVTTENQLLESQVYRGQANDHTFVFIYATRPQGAVQLHAQVISAAGTTHCVQVHVSKMSASPDDLRAWFSGFSKVDIESL